MLKVMFGEITTGRLTQLPYLGYSVFVAAAPFITGIALLFVNSGAEVIIGADLMVALKKLPTRYSVLIIIAMVLIGLAAVAVLLNLSGKRIRDMGLSGGWTLLALVIVWIIISSILSRNAANGFSAIVWFALLLIPSKSF